MKKPLYYVFEYKEIVMRKKKGERKFSRPSQFREDVFEYVKERTDAENFFDYMSKKYIACPSHIVVDIDEEIKNFEEINYLFKNLE